MKISEVIKKLQEIQDEKDDLYVLVNGSCIFDIHYDEKYFTKFVNIHNVDW